MPLNFSGAVSRAVDKINKSPNARQLPTDKFMILSDCISPWYTNVYVSVDTETVDNATVEKISGDFLGKVFEGEYSNMGTWVKEVEKLLPKVRNTGNDVNIGHKQGANKFYFYYPTCPKCSKEYGKNYVVILAAL